MCKKFISKETYDLLSDHIIEIMREKTLLIDGYYREKVEEGMEVEEFFKEYTEKINGFLNAVAIGGDVLNCCPMVVIGSIVEVQDIEDMETYRYQIVLPYSKNTDMSMDCASCLSPLGKALLLSSVGDQISIQIPTGKLRYTVKKIFFQEEVLASAT